MYRTLAWNMEPSCSRTKNMVGLVKLILHRASDISSGQAMLCGFARCHRSEMLHLAHEVAVDGAEHMSGFLVLDGCLHGALQPQQWANLA